MGSEHDFRYGSRLGLEPAKPVLAERIGQDSSGPYPVILPPLGEGAVSDLLAKLGKRPGDRADSLFEPR